MDSDKTEPAQNPTPVENSTPVQQPTPVQGHPTAQYSLFEKLLKKTAKILRQSRS
jgi:hypothetical protein